MGEVTADYMGVAVYYGVSILIISLSATALLRGSFGFRRIGLFTILLMLKFCDVGFSISLSTLYLRCLYSEVPFTGCSCAEQMFVISFCCVVNAYISCSIVLADSLFIPTDTVV